MILPTGEIHPKSTYICGVDPARMGVDETGIVILERPFQSSTVYVCHLETSQKQLLTATIGRVKYLDSKFNFKKIIVDETGLGSGVVDSLKEAIKGRVEGIVFTINSKADIFTNLKLLLQRQILYLSNKANADIAKKLFFQLLSINREFTESGSMKIFHEEGKHDDLVCALALAASYFKKGTQNKRKYGLAPGGNI